SVEPGLAGQRFLPGSLERLKELALLRKRQGLSFQILVDGGVDSVVMEDCVKNGADMLVTGIYVVFNQPDGIVKACGRFNEKMKNIRSEI
ncbi:MAG: ribulose-phosphate 3-epimerase, partial [Oscillospiraceae bacterium]